MNDEETDGLVDLFETNESSINQVIPKACKPIFKPVHLPRSIADIVNRWSRDVTFQSSPSRVGVCPCDYGSLNGMFIHTWGAYHVEQPSRLTAIIEHLHDSLWTRERCRWESIEGRMITDEEITLVHSDRFLQEFLAVERGEMTNDSVSMRTLSYANGTYHFESVGPIVARACRLAAGATLQLISAAVHGQVDAGFALVRPAGHHSSKDQVGTFCGLNSAAIGAVYAVETLGVSRVLILDRDVHRSGGTEDILRRMPVESQHKYRLIDIYAAFGKSSYSDTVSSNCELVNMFNKDRIPGDEEYTRVFDTKILPDIVEFSPSLILISAGFDGAQGESEQCAQITPDGYFQMTRKLKAFKTPLVFILEGGYQLQSLIQSTEATFRALFEL